MFENTAFIKHRALDFLYNNSWTDDELVSVFLDNATKSKKDEMFSSDIVISGCSFTYGSGIKQEYSWPFQLQKILNKKIANFSMNGASISGCINRIFDYIYKVGNPKIILCLFPDPYRGYLPTIKDMIVSDRKTTIEYLKSNNVHLNDFGMPLLDVAKQEYFLPTYSKVPHNIHDVITPEITTFFSIQQIKFLESYCKAANIKLIYSTWDYDTHNLIKKLQHLGDFLYFKNYVEAADLGIYTWKSDEDTAKKSTQHSCFKKAFWPGADIELEKRIRLIKNFKDNPKCHYELRNHDKETFDIAEDKTHWGSHSNIHMAEFFYEKIKDIV